MTMILRRVEADAMAPFAHLTFPALASPFSAAPQAGSPLIPLRFAAWHAGTPAGLALILVHEEQRQAELLSLSVARPFRRQGIGSAILRHVEDHLHGERISALSARFSDGLPGASAFGALVAALGWEGPEPERIRILGEVGRTLDVFRDRDRLLARAMRDGLVLVPWSEYGRDAEAHILREIAEGRAPEWARAGLLSDTFDPEFSMILMKGDTVVGWVICQFHAGLRRWSFPVGWIDGDHQKRGWLLVAYADGARRLGERFGPSAIAVFESTTGFPMMWRVLQDRFAPHAQWADRILRVERRL